MLAIDLLMLIAFSVGLTAEVDVANPPAFVPIQEVFCRVHLIGKQN